MLEAGRHPTAEELDTITMRARRLRALYLGAMLRRAWRRLALPLIGGGARNALTALSADAR